MKKKLFIVGLIFISIIVLVYIGLNKTRAFDMISPKENYVKFANRAANELLNLDPAKYVGKRLYSVDDSGNLIDGYAGSLTSSNYSTQYNNIDFFKSIWCIYPADKVNRSNYDFVISNIIDMGYDDANFKVTQFYCNNNPRKKTEILGANYDFSQLVYVINTIGTYDTTGEANMYYGRYLLSKQNIQTIRGMSSFTNGSGTNFEGTNICEEAKAYAEQQMNSGYTAQIKAEKKNNDSLTLNGRNLGTINVNYSGAKSVFYKITDQNGNIKIDSKNFSTLKNNTNTTIELTQEESNKIKDGDKLVIVFKKDVDVARIFIVENQWNQQRTIVTGQTQEIEKTLEYDIKNPEDIELGIKASILDVQGTKGGETYNYAKSAPAEEGDLVYINFRVNNKDANSKPQLNNIYSEFNRENFILNTNNNTGKDHFNNYYNNSVWNIIENFNYVYSEKYHINNGCLNLPYKFNDTSSNINANIMLSVNLKQPIGETIVGENKVSGILNQNSITPQIPSQLKDDVEINLKSIGAKIEKNVDSIKLNGTDKYIDIEDYSDKEEENGKPMPLVKFQDKVKYRVDITNTGGFNNIENLPDLTEIAVSKLYKIELNEEIPDDLKLTSINGNPVNSIEGKIYSVDNSEEIGTYKINSYGANANKSDEVICTLINDQGLAFKETESIYFEYAVDEQRTNKVIDNTASLTKVYNRNYKDYEINLEDSAKVKIIDQKIDGVITKEVVLINGSPEWPVENLTNYPIVALNDKVTYEITISNITNNNMYEVEFEDVIPKGLELLQIEGQSVEEPIITTGMQITYNSNNKKLSGTIDQIGHVEGKNKRTITLLCNVYDEDYENEKILNKLIINTAILKTAKDSTGKPYKLDKDDSAQIKLKKGYLDAEISKSVKSVRSYYDGYQTKTNWDKEIKDGIEYPLVEAGDYITYEVKVRNIGKDADYNLNIVNSIDFQEEIPEYLELVEIQSELDSFKFKDEHKDGEQYKLKEDNFSYLKDNNQKEWINYTINRTNDNIEEKTIIFAYKVLEDILPEELNKIIPNTANLTCITGKEGEIYAVDREEGNKTSTAYVKLRPIDAKISKKVDKINDVQNTVKKSQVKETDFVEYLVTIENENTSKIYNPVFWEEIPSDLNFIEASDNISYTRENDGNKEYLKCEIKRDINSELPNSILPEEKIEVRFKYQVKSPIDFPEGSDTKEIINTAILKTVNNRNDVIYNINDDDNALIEVLREKSTKVGIRKLVTAVVDASRKISLGFRWRNSSCTSWRSCKI